jgi:hypothetical protein
VKFAAGGGRGVVVVVGDVYGAYLERGGCESLCELRFAVVLCFVVIWERCKGLLVTVEY